MLKSWPFSWMKACTGLISTYWKWRLVSKNHFQCCATIIGHLSESLALIGVNLPSLQFTLKPIQNSSHPYIILPPLKVTLSCQKIQTAVETDKFIKGHQRMAMFDCLQLRCLLFRNLSQCLRFVLENNVAGTKHKSVLLSWDFWRW